MSSELLQGVAAIAFVLTWVLVWQILARGYREAGRGTDQPWGTKRDTEASPHQRVRRRLFTKSF